MKSRALKITHRYPPASTECLVLLIERDLFAIAHRKIIKKLWVQNYAFLSPEQRAEIAAEHGGTELCPTGYSTP